MSNSRKASDCDTCKNWHYVDHPPNDFDMEKQHNEGCWRGHKPVFITPKSPMDMDWGWRRKCDDYDPK